MTSRKRKWKILSRRAMGRIEAGQSITDVALFLRRSSFCVINFTLMETIANHTTQLSKITWVVPKEYNPREDRYIAIVAKRNRRATSTRVPSMVTASIDKAISAASVRRRLHMNGLYAQPDDKRIRIWRKQGTRNQTPKHQRTSPHSGGSIMLSAGISLGYRTHLHIFKRGSVTGLCPVSRLSPRTHCEQQQLASTFVLMDDNARPHRADIVDDYLKSERIAHMARASIFA
ncbi:transposable element Tcb1 transposase [Trichonephila clavipes]|nr:transposable element Tcb1 transposase [Trichonephila clavipes]